MSVNTILTQEGDVGRTVTQELDERLAYEAPWGAARGNHVGQDEQGVSKADGHCEEGLDDGVTTSEPEESVVPQGGKQLLAARVSYKLDNSRQGWRMLKNTRQTLHNAKQY